MTALALLLAASGAFKAAPAAASERPAPVVIAAGTLSWEGEATVYPPGRELRIKVRTRIDSLDNVVSESWPIELGEAKGLRRMTLSASAGTLERVGEKLPMPQDVWAEETAQFGFYRQLQVANSELPKHVAQGVTTFSVPGAVTTWFRIGPDGNLIGAINQVPSGSGQAWQEFRFDGFWHSNGAIFPKQMRMIRDGQRYFLLDVAKFDAR